MLDLTDWQHGLEVLRSGESEAERAATLDVFARDMMAAKIRGPQAEAFMLAAARFVAWPGDFSRVEAAFADMLAVIGPPLGAAEYRKAKAKAAARNPRQRSRANVTAADILAFIRAMPDYEGGDHRPRGYRKAAARHFGVSGDTITARLRE